MRVRALAVACLASLALLPALAGPASAATSSPTSVAEVRYQAQVLQLTNRERTRRGIPALRPYSCADGRANRWASSLSRAGRLSHQPLRPILSACRSRAVAENVAYGNHTPAQVVAAWMRSSGHRANILNRRYTHVGVGSVKVGSGRVYGVQVFTRQ